MTETDRTNLAVEIVDALMNEPGVDISLDTAKQITLTIAAALKVVYSRGQEDAYTETLAIMDTVARTRP